MTSEQLNDLAGAVRCCSLLELCEGYQDATSTARIYAAEIEARHGMEPDELLAGMRQLLAPAAA